MIISFLAILFLLSSCAPKVYYQVFETKSDTEGIDHRSENLVYENETCAVFYNFWGEQGDMGFRLENKTDQPLYLDMGKSYFVLNGTAKDYYKQRVYTYSSGTSTGGSKSTSASKAVTGLDYSGLLLTGGLSSGVTSALSTSESSSVSIPEKEIICIPAYASKVVSEFVIHDSRIRDCDLLLYPKRKEVSVLRFESDNSPVVFENRLVYRIGENQENEMNHRFYVSKVSNMPKDKVLENRKENFCGQESLLEKTFFKETSPDEFFIRYKKGNEGWEH